MNKKMLSRTFSEEKVRSDFSKALQFYDIWAKATETKAAQKALDWASINGNESILEIGTGTGLLFEKLLKRNPEGFTAGIDLSADMLQEAKSRVRQYKDNREYSLREASAYELPFADRRFDRVISCYMLDLLPEEDFPALLNEFKRVLKPGGKLVLVSMTFGWRWYHRFWEWIPRNFPDMMTGCRPIDLNRYVKEAGFNILKSDRISQNTFPSQVFLAKFE